MSDQSKNAGNIGDVFKHSVLPELVLLWLETEPQMATPTYVETHAGFYSYPLHKLKRKSSDAWSGQRAWSLGVLVPPIQGGGFGVYGAALRSELASGFYPGSMRLVELAAASADRDLSITGFDIGREQVESYRDASARVSVEKSDGYEGVDSVPCPRLIFCDPFWGKKTAPDDFRKCRELLKGSSPCVVWYPLLRRLRPFRAWLERDGVAHAELRFRHYQVEPWAGQDLKGSGMATSGLPEGLAGEKIASVAQELVCAFEGERHAGRRLELELSSSFRKPDA